MIINIKSPDTHQVIFFDINNLYRNIKLMKPFRNIYIKSDEETTKSQLSGTLEIPYTGDIFYGIVTEDDVDPSGYDPEQDVYYRCNCEFKEIKEFKRV